MENCNTRELFCPVCGKISQVPVCCTKEMEIDKDIFFCTICGKEQKVPFCCGSYMKIREKEAIL